MSDRILPVIHALCNRVPPKAVLLLLLALGGISTAAGAVEHAVGDVNEFDQAVKTARPGDIVVLADGVWHDAVLAFDTSGKEGQPITLRAETPGAVVLAGNSRLYIGGDYLTVQGLKFADGALKSSGHVIQFRSRRARVSHHCRLTDCAIIDYSPPWPESDEGTLRYFYVALFGTHNRVDHCRFSGHDNSGVTLVCSLDEEPDYHRIDHNYFGPREAPPAQIRQRNGYETIRIGTSTYMHTAPRITVEDNYFHRADGEGEIVSNKSHENIYRNNAFVECQGALTIRQGSKCLIEGNWFLGNHQPNTGGIRVTGEDHLIINNYFHELDGTSARAALCMMNGLEKYTGLADYIRPKNVLVAFNTFVDCRQTVLFGYGYSALDENGKHLWPATATDCTLANNVMLGNGPDRIVSRQVEPVNLTWQGNCVHGSPLGISIPRGVKLMDPKLTGDEEGVFRPAAESPLIHAAEGDYPQVRRDMDGQERLGPKDIGADQFSRRPPGRCRPNPSTVGPGWMR